MGGKRKKMKNILSLSPTTPPPVPAVQDDELLDDLIAQLDSNDTTVQNVSAEVINDIQLSQLKENKGSQKRKKDSKTRFLERQVCIFLRFSKARTTPSSRHGKLQTLFNTALQTILRWMPG
jgi:hypothetical protein